MAKKQRGNPPSRKRYDTSHPVISLRTDEEIRNGLREAKEKNAVIRDKQSLLVFRNAADEQFVVPLNLVERIEKIKRSQIELVGGKNVLQYRGGTLPLFSIDQVAEVKPLDEKEELLVLRGPVELPHPRQLPDRAF